MQAGPLIGFTVFAISLLCGLWGTGRIRRFALDEEILDHPGERSLHSTAVPRGGGLSIVTCVLLCTVFAAATGLIPWTLAATLAGGGTLVALTGWLDDRAGLPASIRGIAYLLAAALAVILLGPVTVLQVGSAVVRLTPLLAWTLTLAAMFWLINLWNFMDGSDGLAGVETVTAALFAALIFALSGVAGMAILCLALAGAASGFLYWNWHPARIFMGDSGSCFIGFVFAVLALQAQRTAAVEALVWIVLLALFVCDATLTLLRRMVAGEKWYSPHRTHAYQLLVQGRLGHTGMASWAAVVNVVLLGPLAVVAHTHPELGSPCLAATLLAGVCGWALVQYRYS